MAKRFGYCRVFKGHGKQPWNWQWRAGNGRIQARGEGHPSQRNAHRAALTTLRNIVDAWLEADIINDDSTPQMIRDGKPRK